MHQLHSQSLLKHRHASRVRNVAARHPVKPLLHPEPIGRVLKMADTTQEPGLDACQFRVARRRGRRNKVHRPDQSSPRHLAAVDFHRTLRPTGRSAPGKSSREVAPVAARSLTRPVIPGLMATALSASSTRSRATASRLIAHPAGRYGKSCSAWELMLPFPGSSMARNRSSSRYSTRCCPMKSSTRHPAFPGAVLSPRPNCWRKRTGLWVGLRASECQRQERRSLLQARRR